MTCHACQTELPDYARYCAQCGVRQGLACSACDTGLTPEMRFCPACGTAQEGPEAAPPPVRQVAEATGDRRVVTVLFTDVSGFTAMSEKLDPAQVTEIVNQFFAVLTEPIYRYGGVVDKYIGDAIMALFGAPVAHEDDPERAVRAGFEMQRVAESFARGLESRTGIRLKVRIGINTGLVVAGAVGGAQKRDYTVMGETVHLAQRMEANARPGKVLVTQETHRHTSHMMDYMTLEPVVIKGKSQPLSVYEVIAPKAEVEQPAEERRMVGRRTELARLRDALQRAVDRVPQLVSLIGDAGIGKSQLSSELFAGLDPALRVEAHRVRAISYEQNTPFALLSDLLRRWLEVGSQADATALDAALVARQAAHTPDERARLTAAVCYVLGLELTHAEFAQLSPQQQRALAFRLVTAAILGGARTRPTLLNFEDLHWVDEASLEWVQSLLDALTTRDFQDSQLLILCQARPVEGSPLSTLRPAINHQSLVLRPLDEAECWELLGHLLEQEGEPADWPEPLRQMGDQLLARAEGNPLFLRELVRALVDAGTLAKDAAGHLEVRGAIGSNLPSTVHGVLSARLDSLPAHLRSVLQLGSVIGRSFEGSLVAEIGRVDEITQSLEALAQAEFVNRRSQGDWQFQQALTHEVVYHSLLLATRRDLHRRVGEALEALMGDRADESPQVLARHYMLGELAPKALYYLFRSGQMAHRNFANQEALNCFEECVRLIRRGGDLPPRPRLDEVLLALSDIQATVGQYGSALTHLEEALTLQSEPAEQAETLRRMGGIANLQGQYKEAMERYERGLALLEGHADGVGRARILLDEGLSLFRQGQFGEVTALCEEVQRLLAHTDHRKERAMAQSILGIVTYRQHRFQEAEQFHQEALRLREELKDVFGVASSLNNLGALYLEQGEWGKTADHYERAGRIYQQIGDVSRQIIQLNNLGDLKRNQGELDGAVEAHEQALELSRTISDGLGEGVAAAGLGMAQLARRQEQAAIASLLAGIAILERINAVEVLPESLAALARAYADTDQFAEADAAVAKAVKISTDNQSQVQLGLVRCAEAVLRLRAKELDRAQRAIDLAVGQLVDGAAPIELARARAIEAAVLAARGWKAEAEGRQAEAAAIFKRLGARADLAALQQHSLV